MSSALSTISSYVVGTIPVNTESLKFVNSVNELKEVSKTEFQFVETKSYYLGTVGGSGTYWHDATDVTSLDNGFTVITANDGGRWKLIINGFVSVKQAGAKGDGVNDDTTRIQTAIDYCALNDTTLLFNSGTYLYTTLLVIGSRQKLKLLAEPNVVLHSTKAAADQTNFNADYAIKLYGTFISTQLLSTAAPVGSSIINVPSTTGMQKGDLLVAKSTRLIENESRGIAYEGQTCLIDEVISGTQIRLSESLQFNAAKEVDLTGTINTSTSTTELVLDGIGAEARNIQCTMTFTSGALSGQARGLTKWDNVTKIATFSVAWPSLPAPGDTFKIEWVTNVLHYTSLDIDISGDFHFTRAKQTNAVSPAFGFRCFDIWYTAGLRIDGIQVSNFSEIGINVNYAYRPIITDIKVSYANRSYDITNGTGYGVGISGCYAANVRGVTAHACRRAVDIGGNLISWDSIVKDVTMYGGGVAYNGLEFWPNGATENAGFGSHGAACQTTYENCKSVNTYFGLTLRGKDEKAINCTSLGPCGSPILIGSGGGHIIDGYRYYDKFTSADFNTDKRWETSNDPTQRPDIFASIYADDLAENCTITLINCIANSVKDRFIRYERVGVDIGSLVVGNNYCRAHREGEAAGTFRFITSADTNYFQGFHDLGGNRYDLNPTDYTQQFYTDIGGTGFSPMNNSPVQLKDDLWYIIIPDDTVGIIPLPYYMTCMLVDVFDQIKDRGYRGVGMLIWQERNIDYSPLAASNKTNVEISAVALTGTTGTDTKVTLSKVDNSFYVENRLGSTVKIFVRIAGYG
jgi:hypothetical protein